MKNKSTNSEIKILIDYKTNKDVDEFLIISISTHDQICSSMH